MAWLALIYWHPQKKASQSKEWETEQQNFALSHVCFLLGCGSECMHCTQNTVQCPDPLLKFGGEGGRKKQIGEETASSWDPVSWSSETSGQTGWQDAESSSSCFSTGPGLVLDPPGTTYTQWSSLPHRGEFRSDPGEWLTTILWLLLGSLLSTASLLSH